MKVYCGKCKYFERIQGTQDFDSGYFYESCLAPPHSRTLSNYRETYEAPHRNTPRITNCTNDCADFVQLDD